MLDDALTARVGRIALRAWGTAGDALAVPRRDHARRSARSLRGRARFRRVDLLRAYETTGVGALAIVALINFLIGAVLAFVGAVQLQPFGAAIYVANLVAIAVTRELGALMTGIVMAGRTGASYAAVIGTMTVNEEVDALRTTGLPPVEFLVLPRVAAAALMVPALVAYADLMGLLGGMLVGVTLLGIGPEEYARQTGEALALRHVFIGLGKGVVFGVVVALTGCYYGVRCGRSAEAVGEATTKAVVMGIVLVVVADAVATVPAATRRSCERGGGGGPRADDRLRRACRAARRRLRRRAGRGLRDHGRQRLRQEHADAPHDRPAAADGGRRALLRRGLLERQRRRPRAPGGGASACCSSTPRCGAA